MSRKVLILDTSVMCCWLDVPGRETAGSGENLWDRARAEALLESEKAAGSTFVLPLATLIESGNHIAQAAHSRYERAGDLMDCLRKSLDVMSPWVAFADQAGLWSKESMAKLVCEWPAVAAHRHSIGDATIRGVADYYSLAGFDVEIATADEALKAYEPRQSAVQPRRRQRTER